VLMKGVRGISKGMVGVGNCFQMGSRWLRDQCGTKEGKKRKRKSWTFLVTFNDVDESFPIKGTYDG